MRLLRTFFVVFAFAGLLVSACGGSPSVPTPPPAGLTADFTAAGTLTQRFTGMSGGGTIVSWDWDFGDGSVHDKTQNPVHAYSPTQQSRNFMVTLTVTDDKGKTASKAQQITVVPAVEVSELRNADPKPQGQPHGSCPKPFLSSGTVIGDFTVQADGPFVVQTYLVTLEDMSKGCGPIQEVCPGAIGTRTDTTPAFSAIWPVTIGGSPTQYCVAVRNRGNSTFVLNGGLFFVH